MRYFASALPRVDLRPRAQAAPRRGAAGAGAGSAVTYVPGFWSVKGVKETVLTSMSYQFVG